MEIKLSDLQSRKDLLEIRLEQIRNNLQAVYGALQDCNYWIDYLNKKEVQVDRKSTRLNSSHIQKSRMPSSA